MSVRISTLILLFTCMFAEGIAQTRTSIGTGVFTNPTVWDCTCIPGPTESIVVSTGNAISLVANTTILNVDVQSGADLVVSSGRLQIDGNLIVNGLISGTNTVRLTGSGTTIDGVGEISIGGILSFRTGNKTILSTANISYTGLNIVEIRGVITVTNLGQFYAIGDLNGTNNASIWTNGANAIVGSGGKNFMSKGLLNANASGNEVIYSRLGDQTIVDPFSASTYHHLTVEGSGIKSLANNVVISGNLSLKGGDFSTLNNSITLSGDFASTGGTFQEGTGLVTLIGTGSQEISSLLDEVFYNLTINKSSGDVQLNVDVNVVNVLNLINGLIYTGSNKIVLGSSVTVLGTPLRTNGYIVGNFERWIGNALLVYTFDVGTSSYYRPATITFASVSSGLLQTSFIENLPGDVGLPILDGVDSVRHTFIAGYWQMINSGGLTSNNYSLTLAANGFNSYPINASTRLLTRSNSLSSWIGSGSHVPAVSPNINRAAITMLPAEFAIGDTTKCTLPSPSTSPISGSDTVCANASLSGYSVLNTPGSTYLWNVVGGTPSAGTTNSITVNWGATGMIGQVEVIEDNGCEYGSKVILPVVIEPLPVDTIFGALTVEENQNGVAYSVTPSAGYTYTWSISGGNLASSNNVPNITVNWLSAGTGSVNVTATNACGTSATYTVAIDIVDFIKSITSGPWNNNATWDCSCTPTITSNVIIQSGDSVYLTGNSGANYLRIENGSVLNALARRMEITGDFLNNGKYYGTNRLDISGSGNSISGNGSFANHTGVIRINAGVHTIESDVVIIKTGDVDLQANATIINYGHVETTDDVLGRNNTTSNWYNESNSTLKSGLTIMSTGNLYTSSSGNTVSYFRQGTGGQNIKAPNGNSYYNLMIEGNNVASVKSLTANVIISGDLTLAGSTFDVTTNNRSINLAGNWNNTGGAFEERLGTVFFDGDNQTINHSSSETFYTIDVSSSTALTLNSDINVSRDLVINSGSELDVNTNSNHQINLSRHFTNSGSFQQAKGLVNFNGTTQQLVTGNTTFHNVSVNNSSTGVVLSSGQIDLIGILTLTNGNINANGNLTLISDANGTARIAEITGGSITGNMTMERYIAAGSTNWRFLSSAVSGATLSDWDNDFITSGFPGSNYPTFPFISILRYDESKANIRDTGYFGPTIVSEPINVGEGYLVWCGDNLGGTNAFTIDVVGTANTGNIALPVNFTSTGFGSHDGWNVVGNPYPSTIDWDAPSGWTKSNMMDAIYIWDANQQQFASYIQSVGTNGGSRYIPSSQAFWVQADTTAPVLSLSESVKVDTNHTFLRQSAPDDQLRIEISGNGFRDETVLRINNQATFDSDPNFDAWKIYSSNPKVPSISTILNQKDYAINSVPEFTSNQVVSLKTSVKKSGIYNLKFSLNNYHQGFSCLILHDRFLNTDIVITGDTIISKNLSDTTKIIRFDLTLAAPLSSTMDSISCHNASNGLIQVTGNGSGPWDYTWKNSGRVIKTNISVAGFDQIDNLSEGLYSVKVDNSGICGSQGLDFNLVNPDPIIADFSIFQDTVWLSEGGKVELNNTSKNATTFNWDFGDGNTSGDFHAEHVYTSGGSYTIELTAVHSICQEKKSIQIEVIDDLTGVKPIVFDIGFEVYSFDDVLYIKGKNDTDEIISIVVYNSLGKEISSLKVSDRVVCQQIQNQYSDAVWIVKIQKGSQISTKKVLLRSGRN